MPATLPKELQDMIKLMLNVDPKERIIIPDIKQHPWYLGLPDDTPRKTLEREPPEVYNLQLKEVQDNVDVLTNLKLLGWEESELMNELLSTEPKPNMAKVFYKLLTENKNVPIEPEPEPTPDPPKPIDKKAFRRRSVGAPTRGGVAKIATSDSPKPNPAEVTRLRTEKRASQRVDVRRSDRPMTRQNKLEKSRERSATVGEDPATIMQSHTQHHEPPRTKKHTEQQSLPSGATSTLNPLSVIGAPNLSSGSVTLAPIVPNSHSKHDKGGKAVVWGVSPSMAPESKKYSVDSNKNVTQLLESLRHCFADLPYELSAKQTKNGIKVKARKSGKRHGPPVATVNLLQKEHGETELILKGGGKSKEQFKELAKKVEETLLV